MIKTSTVFNMSIVGKVVLIISAVFFSFSLINADTNSQNQAKKYIGGLTANIPTLPAQELRKMLASKDVKPLLLDVRTYYERSQTKTILGEKEIHIPRGFLEVKAWGDIPKDRPVIVYCSKGTRSKLAVKTLQEMGWTNVTSLEGGVRAWYESVDEPCGCLPEQNEIPDKEKENLEGCKP